VRKTPQEQTYGVHHFNHLKLLLAAVRMPILADTLQDGGCDNEDIHCRQPGEHARGCWLLDALLGKG